MATLAEIYDWFMTGKKPTQAQFWASWGSFWNKGESIPQSAISNLTTVLSAKAEKAQFDAHKTDVNAHAALFANAKIYPVGELQIFKVPGNTNNLIIEPGDYCIGFVEGQFINATYLGGDRTLLSSFDI